MFLRRRSTGYHLRHHPYSCRANENSFIQATVVYDRRPWMHAWTSRCVGCRYRAELDGPVQMVRRHLASTTADEQPSGLRSVTRAILFGPSAIDLGVSRATRTRYVAMDLSLDEALPLLHRDVERTLGAGYATLIDEVARDVRLLGPGDATAKTVNDVQQHFHDMHIDPTWPTCPRHERHPLWYRDGAWWCAQDGVPVARLGELSSNR